jgi:hypothetical protein
VEEGDVDNLGDSVPDLLPRVEDDNAELMVKTASMSCLLMAQRVKKEIKMVSNVVERQVAGVENIMFMISDVFYINRLEQFYSYTPPLE